MKSKHSNEENAFQEGLQDNTVKLSDDQEDPKSHVTNQDQQVTNEDEQNIVTVEVDDHGDESAAVEENTTSEPKKPGIDIPEAGNRDDQPVKTES